jgi:hypothetical protein
MNQLLLGHVIENMNKSDRSANGQNRLGRHNAFMGDDIIVKIKTVQAMAIEVSIYLIFIHMYICIYIYIYIYVYEPHFWVMILLLR